MLTARGGSDAWPLVRCDGRIAGDPRGIDPDVEVGRRQPIADGGEVGACIEATESVRRDIAHVHRKPGEDGPQIVGCDLHHALQPGAVAALRQPAGELDVGTTGQQGRGRLERDDTIVQYKSSPGLTDDAVAPGEGADLEIDRRRHVCGNYPSNVI